MKREMWGGNPNEQETLKKTKTEEEESVSSVTSFNNHIYLYGEVNPQSILEMETKIFESTLILIKAKAEQKLLNPLGPYDPYIYLHINSPGGYLTSGLAGSDVVEKNTVPIVTIVEGEAASAATLISMAGKQRWITQNSSMRVHQLRGGGWGKLDDIQDETINLGMYDQILKDFYKTKTNLTKKELDSLLKRELDFSASVCLKKGFVDKII